MAVEGFPKLGRLETALDPKSKPRKLRNIASTRSSIVVIVVVGIFGIISHQHNHRTEAYIGMSPRLFYWELRRRYCSKVNLLSVCHRRIPVSTNKPGLPGTSSWQQLRTSASPLSFPFISSLPQLETATTDTPSAAVSTTYQIVFDIVVPEGRCVGLKVMDVPDSHPDALRYDAVAAISNVTTKPHWINDCLHPEEVNFGVQSLKGDTHRKSFWIGRLAMRQALVAYDRPLSQPRQQPWDAPNISIDSIRNSQSILKDTHGRPKLPYGFLGSISHKGNMGVALVTKENVSAHQVAVPPKWGIGVDIEEAIHADRRKIARKVLTLNEQADLGRIPVSPFCFYPSVFCIV